MFSTARYPTINTDNTRLLLLFNLFIFKKKTKSVLFFLGEMAFLLTFSILEVSANDNASINEASTPPVELIPDYKKDSPTPKVNSITHQETNDPRSLEAWPNTSTQDPLSHKVLYQEWTTPDSNENEYIDAKVRQKNNQAFLKWLKQLNQEKKNN
ncbi:hypothetical protein [uncultured Shewanella sp.]|uniref:hypothetical protein n=1 Tax=uncultured Shewanella sp. TaxID=173975 RepID=UPI002637EC4B|nr:hypothetical protein [uncultured Shewanella sp.]